jgi:hypothetical protein
MRWGPLFTPFLALLFAGSTIPLKCVLKHPYNIYTSTGLLW